MEMQSILYYKVWFLLKAKPEYRSVNLFKYVIFFYLQF